MKKEAACKWCKNIFSYEDKQSKGIFCSRECHQKHRQHMVTCKNCSKGIIKYKKTDKAYCSFDEPEQEIVINFEPDEATFAPEEPLVIKQKSWRDRLNEVIAKVSDYIF